MTKSKIQEQINQYYVLWREIMLAYEDWAKKHNLSYKSMMTLYSLFENKNGCTQKEICIRWRFPKQTVNTILKEFAQKDLIEFLTCEVDRRNKIAILTKKGRLYANDIIPKLLDLEISVMEKMGETGRNALIESSALFLEYFREGSN